MGDFGVLIGWRRGGGGGVVKEKGFVVERIIFYFLFCFRIGVGRIFTSLFLIYIYWFIRRRLSFFILVDGYRVIRISCNEDLGN